MLALLRHITPVLMKGLTIHNPYLADTVLNSTASEHSDTHLQVFCDSSKDMTIFLLNTGVDFETTGSAHFIGCDEVEALSLLQRGQWPARPESRGLTRQLCAETGTPVDVHIALYDMNDVHGVRHANAIDKTRRGDAAAIRALLSQG